MLIKSDIIVILKDAFKQSPILRKGDTQLLFRCPFCNRNDQIRKLEICVDGDRLGYSHCWRCDFKSRSFGSLLRKLNAPFHLRDRLFKLSGEIRTYRKSSNVKKTEETLSLPTGFVSLSRPTNSQEYKNAIKYLKKRNVLMDDIIRYNIGYCEIKSEYQNHIIIPSYDDNNELNFFIGRQYYDNSVYRYKKPKRDMNIIGFENMINWKEDVNLAEGVFDCFAIRKNAIPLFGKYPSKKLQEKLIFKGVKRVNIILDNDAMDDAIKNCERLAKYGINIHWVKLNEKDPSQLGFEKVTELIKNSVSYNWEQGLLYKISKL